jgi:hypothetical protein
MIPQSTSLMLPINAAPRLPGGAPENESNARAAMEVPVGGVLTDPDWGRARARPLEFVSILRAWHREYRVSESEALNVA